jgi:ABC-2 type transport system ATP-binding protein
MEPQLAISAHNIHKDFVLPHERAGSIKSLFTGLGRGRTRGASVQHALRGVSFDVRQGEFFGIVGRNGSGKSTLLKLLANIYQPTSGDLTTQGKLVPFIELGVGFNPELTGRENIFLNGAMLGFSRKQVAAMYKDIVSFAELERFMDQKLKNYSSGMQVRLAFSMAIRSEADILLIDEVLAVGDADFQRKCFSYFRSLKKQHKTVVFVSHDMDAVRDYCDRAILIEGGKIIKEGSSAQVAASYSRLFLEASDEESGTQQTRWGNGAVKYVSAKCLPKTLADEKTFTIQAKVKVQRDVDEAVFGFSVKNSADQLLLGGNTKLLGKKFNNLKAGQEIELEWTADNVLNDGEYYVNLAAEMEASEPTDWWDEALKLEVLRDSKTGFLTHPTIRLKVGHGK